MMRRNATRSMTFSMPFLFLIAAMTGFSGIGPSDGGEPKKTEEKKRVEEKKKEELKVVPAPAPIDEATLRRILQQHFEAQDKKLDERLKLFETDFAKRHPGLTAGANVKAIAEAAPPVSIFEFHGSAAAQASLQAPIAKFNFPWELLLPEMQKNGITKITIEFANLDQLSALRGRTFIGAKLGVKADAKTEVRPYFRKADRQPIKPNTKAHEDGKNTIGGQAFRGGIQINSIYRGNQAAIDEILGSELAHEIDFFYLEANGMEEKLNALLHPVGQDGHTWWWGDYSRDYFDQPGESWMAGFGIAYSDFMDTDTRFSHQFTKAMAPKIREILKAERTDKPRPPNGDVPSIASPLSASGTPGVAFSYQIVASNSPTSYTAIGLPAGLSINGTTGLISGTPSAASTSSVSLGATNAKGTGKATLMLSVGTTCPPAPANPNFNANVLEAIEYWRTKGYPAPVPK